MIKMIIKFMKIPKYLLQLFKKHLNNIEKWFHKFRIKWKQIYGYYFHLM